MQKINENKLAILQNPKSFSSDDFLEFANTLLNHCLLQLPLTKSKKVFRLCEIEFYLFNEETHKDEYVHCSQDQMKWHKFYFHRHRSGTYKSGTYKGMDFTFGDQDAEVYFGVLVRSIMDLHSGQIIEGPCRSVNKILELYNCHDVKEFVSKFGPKSESICLFSSSNQR